MSIVGIVGSEALKFTPATELAAKTIIRQILSQPGVEIVCSGHCHLGGVDIWAEDIGMELGLVPLIFPPSTQSWETGYKPRNLQIATHSDILHCITVREYPDTYTGMKFLRNYRPFCYHCNSDTHLKSGGCWTLIQARNMGKEVEWHIV